MESQELIKKLLQDGKLSSDEYKVIAYDLRVLEGLFLGIRKSYHSVFDDYRIEIIFERKSRPLFEFCKERIYEWQQEEAKAAITRSTK